MPCPERPDGKRVKDSPNDPRYLKLFGKAVEELGKRFDKDETLDCVDVSLGGAWGEGSMLFPEEDMKTLMDIYVRVFPNTKLLGQFIRVNMLKHIDDYTNEELFEIQWRIFETMTNLYSGEQELYTTIRVSILDDFKKYIELGVYKYNDKLPSVRTLAIEMGINPNTIQRAYQMLESEGYITTIEKKGVYVAYKKDDAKALLKDKVKKEITIIKQSNISKEELFELIEEVYNDSN